MATIYCEMGVGIFATQPINTLSNLAFWIAAYVAFCLVRKHQIESPLIKSLPFLAFGIGAGSILWHGAPSELTVFFDDFFIVLFAAASLFYLLQYLFVSRLKAGLMLAGIFALEAPFIFHWFPQANGFVPYGILLAVSLMLTLGVAQKNKAHAWSLVKVLLLFALALFFRTIDLHVCEWIHFGSHLLWHFLNAAVTYYVVKLFVGMEAMK